MRKIFKTAICIIFVCILLIGCGKSEYTENERVDTPQKIGQMDLKYAKEFSVDFYDRGYSLITIAGGGKYVLVPEGEEPTDLGIEDAVIIPKPLSSIYLAASSVMDLFRELDELDKIKSCSTKASDYSIAEAVERIENGQITYVGKYSAPDYERLLVMDTSLAIESTMIYHNPKVKEELERLDIPVLTDHSSYENKPLGRLEWIKLYGLLVGKSEEANIFFEDQAKKIENLNTDLDNETDSVNAKKKVVFFYVTSNGYVNIRKPDDYVPKMIDIAGGEYALNDIKVDEDNALGTMNISWEDFYVYAKDADILIYNSTVNDGIKSVSDLLEINALFNDFKAVQNKKVFCSTSNMYQETSKIGEVILEMRSILEEKCENLKYINYVGD